jgi:SAM-dependent methyltransferase
LFKKFRSGVKGAKLGDKMFHSHNYLRHNARRQEHLASLGIPLAGKTVLEVGAGIGDHSHFFKDRGCSITITEARSENLHLLKTRYPDNIVEFLDIEHPTPINGTPFDAVYCYGLLYHLKDPEQALEFLSQQTKKILLLETCVSFGKGDYQNSVSENERDPTQAFSGTGNRPTREWIFKRLQGLFENVYVPKTQPNHEEFPIDWSAPDKHKNEIQRAVFIASREVLDNNILSTSMITKQKRHE